MRPPVIAGTILLLTAIGSCSERSVKFVPASNLPSPIVLRDIRTFGDAEDRSAIMEVVNDSNRAVDPLIMFHDWDKAGQPRRVQSPLAFASMCSTVHTTGILWPHEKMPCLIEVAPGVVTVSYDVVLENDERPSGGRVRTDLKVVGAQLIDGSAVGWVQNPNSAAICSPRVAVSFYDASGRIVGWEAEWIRPGRIEPGGRAPFKVLAYRPAAPPASLSAKAWTLDPLGSKCDG